MRRPVTALGIEPKTTKSSEMDVPGCPKTGQTSGNCPGMRYFSTTDLMRANHKFLGKICGWRTPEPELTTM